jgi:hypothetical protein
VTVVELRIVRQYGSDFVDLETLRSMVYGLAVPSTPGRLHRFVVEMIQRRFSHVGKF